MSDEVRGAAVGFAASTGPASEQGPHAEASSDSGEARAQRAGLEALEREFKDLLQHR